MASFVRDFHVWVTAWASGLGWPEEAIVRLVLASALGALVGVEREVRGRQAGFRTNLLVALGCALVMVVSISVAYQPWPHSGEFNVNVDPARIAYGVMTGIGFLGAGVIVKHEGGVRGLTTAAGLWCVAAIGLACGQGLYVIAVVAAALVLGALWFLDYLENLMPKMRYRVLVVRRRWHPGVVVETVEMVSSHEHLGVRDIGFQRSGEDLAVVEIRLRVAFADEEQYFKFERDLNGRADCQVVSSSSET